MRFFLSGWMEDGGEIALPLACEGTMHIHGGLNVNSASLYSAAGAEKAAEAQRAADVRRKLLKGASEVGEVPGDEESLMIGRWMGGAAQGSDERDATYHTAAAGKDSDFG